MDYYDDKCLSCYSRLKADNKCVCSVCGSIQSADCVSPGDKLVYYPTIAREDDDLYFECEEYKFFPGMEMTIKGKVESITIKGMILLTVEEVDTNNKRFIPADFRLPSYVPGNMKRERLMYYLSIWHYDKYKFFEFRKGQKVMFKPSYITKIWHENEPDYHKLVEGEVYEITQTKSRRYLRLDAVNLDIYWKDVEKFS